MPNIIEKDKIYLENRVWIRIASACNNKCIFCLDSDAHNGTFGNDIEIKKQILCGYKSGEYNKIILSGGEASINPKFSEYIKYAKKIGYEKIQTVTNGNMFCDIDFCKKVIESGLNEITFSFHGHNESLHDYLVGTVGAFKKSLKGLINIKKFFPNIIVNIDIVVNKINISYLLDIIKFFMKFGVYEYDILQIIPFGRGFKENKDKLFYDISEYKNELNSVWELSKIPGMNIWTNRFPIEAFSGYEELIQDPQKIKSEIMTEAYNMYSDFILKKIKPECFQEKRCDFCFLNQYCQGIINIGNIKIIEDLKNSIIINGKNIKDINNFKGKYLILRGEEKVENIYAYFGDKKEDFLNFIKNLSIKKDQFLVNIPICIRSNFDHINLYESFEDLDFDLSLENYTKVYISNLYRKKSLNCKKCKHDYHCQGIHINFLRAYSFEILKPI